MVSSSVKRFLQCCGDAIELKLKVIDRISLMVDNDRLPLGSVVIIHFYAIKESVVPDEIALPMDCEVFCVQPEGKKGVVSLSKRRKSHSCAGDAARGYAANASIPGSRASPI